MSKFDIYHAEIIELLKKHDNKYALVARLIGEKYGFLKGHGKPKTLLSEYCRKVKLGNNTTPKLEVVNKSKTSANDYSKPFVLSAWNKKGYMMDIDEYCDYYKLPRPDITSYKLVSHTGTPYYNIVFKTKEEFKEDLTEDFINTAVQKYLHPRKLNMVPPAESVKTLRVIITDCHIGMETNINGYGLYGGVWNEEELSNRGEKIFNEIVNMTDVYGSFDEIHIIDLGDYLDGWDGLTVRQGHELPQNMDNQKAFNTGLDFKVKLIEQIAALGVAKKIMLHNITNDNHSGAFGYVVNSAVEKIANLLYKGYVEVINYRSFINHYTHGKHCFILSHGKDEKHLKFGFKPILDKAAIDKINEYIDVNELHGYWITFEKGDSHQQLFDHTTSDKFNYNNYMALSPASEWIQTNYKRGRSGFSIQVLDKNKKEITQTAYEFEWKNKGKIV